MFKRIFTNTSSEDATAANPPAPSLDPLATPEQSADIAGRLREFEPFDELDPADCLLLATKTTIEHAAKGAVLFRVGDADPWMLCLTEGSLDLLSDDGRHSRIDAGTRSARRPVAQLKPRKYTATAATEVRYLRLDASGLGNLNAAVNDSGYAFEVLDQTQSERDADACRHSRHLHEGELVLPSLPAVALQTQRLIEADSHDAAVLAKVIMNDPPIAAKLVKAANSPIYYGKESIESTERAIVRLGLKTTRQLVVVFAVRELFKTRSGALQARMQAIWQHSTEVAAICFVLSLRLRIFDPNEAQLAGLIHDIGLIPIMNYADSHPDLADRPEALEALARRHRPAVARRLLETWRFPESLVAAATDCEEWWRDPDPMADLTDLVIIAQLMSYIGKQGVHDVPPIIKLPAFRKLAAGRLEPGDVLELMTESQAQIAEVQGLLRG